METICFYTAGHSAALSSAVSRLGQSGFAFTDRPENATHLLLDVPIASDILLPENLPKDITVLGGRLNCPALSGYRKLDLLEDPFYTAENAHITACCALQLAMDRLPVVLTGLPVLVIGWGRIGKCLASLLQKLGARVTVAARKETDRAMLHALGYGYIHTEHIDVAPYRLIFNTVPVMLLPQCPGNALKIDLASQPGLGGLDVVWARGLPGRYAPESAGDLIAGTIARLVTNKEDSV